MEGRRTDNGHVTVKTQISRDGDPEQPDLVASCISTAWNTGCRISQRQQTGDIAFLANN